MRFWETVRSKIIPAVGTSILIYLVGSLVMILCEITDNYLLKLTFGYINLSFPLLSPLLSRLVLIRSGTKKITGYLTAITSSTLVGMIWFFTVKSAPLYHYSSILIELVPLAYITIATVLFGIAVCAFELLSDRFKNLRSKFIFSAATMFLCLFINPFFSFIRSDYGFLMYIAVATFSIIALTAYVCLEIEKNGNKKGILYLLWLALVLFAYSLILTVESIGTGYWELLIFVPLLFLHCLATAIAIRIIKGFFLTKTKKT